MTAGSSWARSGLIVAFMAAEVVVGLLVDSLALLADAGHMLTDAAAIGLALVAMRLAARPASGAYTYGLQARRRSSRAQINGLTLAVLHGRGVHGREPSAGSSIRPRSTAGR